MRSSRMSQEDPKSRDKCPDKKQGRKRHRKEEKPCDEGDGDQRDTATAEGRPEPPSLGGAGRVLWQSLQREPGPAGTLTLTSDLHGERGKLFVWSSRVDTSLQQRWHWVEASPGGAGEPGQGRTGVTSRLLRPRGRAGRPWSRDGWGGHLFTPGSVQGFGTAERGEGCSDPLP